MDSVRVRVPSRLHLGFLDINGSLGRKFGSLGLALSAPVTQLTLKRSGETRVLGQEAVRAEHILRQITQALKLANTCELNIEQAIPAHAGLGSGTQLALGIAWAVRQLWGVSPDPISDAVLLDRGVRSGAGIGLFSRGGVVLDAGRSATSGLPPIVSRVAFPDAWRIVLVLDHRMHGVHGSSEIDAFAQLPLFSEADAGQLCRIALIQALPALIEHDIVQFGLAIAEIQRKLGDYFAPAQGGRYTSAKVAGIMSIIASVGGHGCGQSSWGPTGFAFSPSQEEAESLVERVRPAATAAGIGLMIVSGNNHGAEVTG